MTKHLRFTMKHGKYVDDLTGKEYHEKLESWKVCNLLNELVEENEQLKLQNQQLDIAIKNNQLAYYDLEKENEQLTQYRLELIDDCNNLIDNYNKLERENEQLKSENKNLKSNVDDLMDMELEDRDIVCMAGKFRLEEWGKHRLHQFYDGDTPLEDETVVMRLLDLTKENEQLKQTITEAYKNERTHIGRNVLKQLLEAIQ